MTPFSRPPRQPATPACRNSPAQAAIGSRWGGWDAFDTDLAEQLTLMRQALESLPPTDSPLRAELMAMLGHTLYYGSGQAAEARDLADRALEMIGNLDAPEAEFGVIQATAFRRWEPPNLAQRLAASERMLEIARGDRRSRTDRPGARLPFAFPDQPRPGCRGGSRPQPALRDERDPAADPGDLEGDAGHITGS